MSCYDTACFVLLHVPCMQYSLYQTCSVGW